MMHSPHDKKFITFEAFSHNHFPEIDSKYKVQLLENSKLQISIWINIFS